MHFTHQVVHNRCDIEALRGGGVGALKKEKVYFSLFLTDVTHFLQCRVKFRHSVHHPPPIMLPIFILCAGVTIGHISPLLLQSLCRGYYRTNAPSSSSSSSHPACLYPQHSPDIQAYATTGLAARQRKSPGGEGGMLLQSVNSLLLCPRLLSVKVETRKCSVF